jgi:hypothetical protein
MLNHAVEFASYFLEGGQLPSFPPFWDGFPSFGVGIGTRGELVEFNCLPAPVRPGDFDVLLVRDQLALFAGPRPQEPSATTIYHKPIPIQFVARGIKQCAAEGRIHTVALVDRVDVPPANVGWSTYAIQVQIEHVETRPVIWYQPYRLSDHKIEFGERSSEIGRPFVFG